LEFTKKDITILKGVAIMFMLLLHLFTRKEVNGLYETFFVINGVPAIYYIGLFGDACVPIYCFASGYGLFVSMNKAGNSILSRNFTRLFKLLINYWIVLVIFVGLGFFIGNPEVFPGSPVEFLLNFFVLSNSYNGAWWFVQTYIILVLTVPFLFKIIKKYNSINILLFTGIIYFVSYVQRIKHMIDFGDNMAINMFVNAVVLFGTSLLPFVVGAIFAKDKIYSRVHKKFYKIKYKNIICLTGILSLVIIHGVIETMFIAPFTAITFICLFNLMNKTTSVQRLLNFLGNHSTNIWLTHMFFYMTIFPELTFAPRYPVLIFAWLIALCLASSFVINAVYKPIVKIVDGKSSKTVATNYSGVVRQKTS
jgi:surface polysaccharide O-acyltransferase-like enzyme